MGSVILTTKDVAREIERLAAESAFGYVHVIVANGRIERIDRCVQIKPGRIAVKEPGAVAAQPAVGRN